MGKARIARRVPGRRDARSRRDGVRATPGADRRRRRGIKERRGFRFRRRNPFESSRARRRDHRARAHVGRGGGRRAGGDAAAGAPDQGPRHRRARARRRRRRLDSGPARAFRLSRVRRARGLSAAAHRGGHAYAAARDGERDSRRAECRGQTRARSRGPIPARRLRRARRREAGAGGDVARVSARPRVFPRGAREVRAHGALAGLGAADDRAQVRRGAQGGQG